MSPKVFALLAGIDDYQEVNKLSGCINDINAFEAWLKGTTAKEDLVLKVLRNSEATRDGVITGFRNHLKNAGHGDVALFYFCGHGAQSRAAPDFHEFDQTGFDEGIVCYDSRASTTSYDLADKELAVLIDELSQRQAHVVVILDACHSGSGTRALEAFGGTLRARMTSANDNERPLDSYLLGHYSTMKQTGRLVVPSGRHLLMSACDRRQLAQEDQARSRGVFSATLLDVLNQAGGEISYADLFMRCRSAVRKYAKNQDPQFEHIGQFNPWDGFLGRQGKGVRRTYKVEYDTKERFWRLNYGAIHGMPNDEAGVNVLLYREGDREQPLATVKTSGVGIDSSSIDLGGFAADIDSRYDAEVPILPVPPLLFHCPADSPARDALHKALEANPSVGAALTEDPQGTSHAFQVDVDIVWLVERETGAQIHGAKRTDGGFGPAAEALLPTVRHVVNWRRCWALQNPATKIDASLVEFIVAERVKGAPVDQDTVLHRVEDLTIESEDDVELKNVEFKARNRTQATLYYALIYLSSTYQVSEFNHGRLEPGSPLETLHAERFFAEEEEYDHIKLLVSTSAFDTALLHQEALMGFGEILAVNVSGRGAGSQSGSSRSKPKANDWLAKNVRLRTVRRADAIGKRDFQADGVTAKGHDTITATLSISSARSGSRSADGHPSFLDAFDLPGLALPSLASTRGDALNVVELNDIQAGAATTRSEINAVLAVQPLRIELDLKVADNEGILPLVFDGEYVQLGSHATVGENGRVSVSIDHLPDIPTNRRSLGGSLKLYFLKTYLKREDVNELRWVDYPKDGSSDYKHRKDGVAGKVAAARNILLMVHGIIGDTEGMALGIRQCGLDRRFDLVLTFDYENLQEPIEDTAANLKRRLAEVGLAEGDGKRLTMLVHSMGGLVSRWFIERLGGNRIVDHLVMCGTPNNGSPFGKIDDARKILTLLTGVAANFAPTLLPFAGPLLFALGRSERVTRTLTQMNPDSDFIKALNMSPDPGIPYTVLAGDVDQYDAATDKAGGKLLTKVGRGGLFDALFAQRNNDIAVAVDSIESVGAGAPARARPARTHRVACHHLNYFVSDAGQKALTQFVEW